MKLIFYHFLHLYFLTEFEIIFYIYYIMPYEKQLIFKLFDTNDLEQILPSYNKTIINSYYNKNKCVRFNESSNEVCYPDSNVTHNCRRSEF